MDVLLTGGAGYIGLHTAVALADAGYGVVIADSFHNSTPDACRRAEALCGGLITVYRADVTDPSALNRIFEAHPIGAVVHLAGLKAVGESVEKPLWYYRNNLDALLAVLETMAAHDVGRLVFSSSATVYGVPEAVPVPETAALRCANPYGWTKWMAEQILADACRANTRLSAVSLRYFNPGGAHESGRIGEEPRGTPNNLLPLVAQAAAGEIPELMIYGGDYATADGTGVRDYIHVMDLAEGHVAALGYTEGRAGFEAVNLGAGAGHSVLELIGTFERVNGVTVPYALAPRRPGDVDACYADIGKAQSLFGWRPKRTLEDLCRDAWRAAVQLRALK